MASSGVDSGRLVRKRKLSGELGEGGSTSAATPRRDARRSIPDRIADSRVAIAGVGAAAGILGQLILDRRPGSLEPTTRFLQELQPIWPDSGAVVASIGCFVLAALCFGWAVRRVGPPGILMPSDLIDGWIRRPSAVASALLGVGGILVAWVVYQLAVGPYAPSQPRWYSLGLLLIVAGFVCDDRARIRTWRPRLAWPRPLVLDGVLLAVGAVTFVLLTAADRASWYFSTLGDEYSFYDAAKQFAQSQVIRNLFSQRGAYDVIPVLSSYYQGILMRVVGLDASTWKLVNVVPVLLAVVAMYGLARSLYGRRVAALTLGLLVTAHYLLAYTHTGYPNLEPLLPTVVALWCFILGVRRSSWRLLALSGAFAGLGWYTFYTSRAAIIILGLAILLALPSRRWVAAGLSVGAGFLVLFLPLLATNKAELITRMLEQSGEGSSGEVVANRAMLPIWNVGRSLLAFNYNVHNGPYLSGSLVESVTAVLFVLGLGYALVTWRDSRSRIVLIWFAVGMLVAGILSKYDYVSVSRMHYVLPAVILLAALAGDRLIEFAVRASTEFRRPGTARLESAVAVCGVIVIVGLTTYGNLHRWFVETPAHAPSTPEALTIRVVEDPRCQGAAMPPLIIAREIGGALPPATAAIGIPVLPVYGLYTDSATWLRSVGRGCVIFRSPRDPDAVRLVQQIAARNPQLRVVDERDLSGVFTVLVYYPPSRG
jgi:4-amino-4-deoxy-L-arabinose transferase-like glycosyltransferase